MLIQNYSISGSDSKPIHIDLFLSDAPGPRPIVIFAHGFKGFKDWGTHNLVAKYFAENGLNFLKFNFSHNGVGKSSGDVFDDMEGFATNTFSKELFDLNQVITSALSGERFNPPTELFLIGHSLGGGLSIIQTSEDKAISKLVTWASISSFRNLWSPQQEKQWIETGILHFVNSRTNQQMPIYSTLLDDLTENSERLDILAAAQKISQPWLIVHGENDPAVPVEHAKELHKQQQQNALLIIPGADHVFCAKHPWDQEHLPPALKEACDATTAFFKGMPVKP
jgi:dienelactone hydrolase